VSAHATRRLRVLAVTPYSPLYRHGHASDDIGAYLYDALGRECELTVYSPAAGPDSVPANRGELSYVFVEGSAPRARLGRLAGIYPAAARKDWSAANTSEVLRLVEVIKPDRLHVDYLQPAEAALSTIGIPWSLTLHDIGSVVSWEAARVATGPVKLHRLAEAVRTRHLEHRVLANAADVFVLSANDETWVRGQGGNAHLLRLGIEPSQLRWALPHPEEDNVILFAGAMWREANERTALWLIDTVMPLVRRELPKATLRIVGDRPSNLLRARAAAISNVDVVGHVNSLDAEYARASVVAAPTVVSAGILLKVQRALACGAPMVVNTAAAAPLGLIPGTHALVGDAPADFARNLITALTSADLRQHLGNAAFAYARGYGGWAQTSNDVVDTLRRTA
jgi:glycosyltransferase involved in cell wall biosynthesis